MYRKSVKKRLGILLLGAVALIGLSHGARAEERPNNAGRSAEPSSLRPVLVDDSYALGLARFDLDAHTEILGWQVSERWYFGRQDGEDSGLTLVWQANLNQVSLSKEGVRLTHRF